MLLACTACSGGGSDAPVPPPTDVAAANGMRRLGTVGYYVLLPNLYYRECRADNVPFDLAQIRESKVEMDKMFRRSLRVRTGCSGGPERSR